MLFSTSQTFLGLTVLSSLVASSNGFLDAKMKGRGKVYLGSILDGNTISDTSITNVLKTEFGAITAEYSWKWPRIQSTQGVFDFNASDSVLNWAIANGKLIRGHTLVWHQNIPQWVDTVTDKPTLTSIIQTHINVVVGRYRGKVYAWDVVNELFEEDGNFRNSVFYRVLQEDFIDIAFRAARAADPAAKLYIGEYNLDYAGPKIDALLALVSRLQARGVPIDGIGSQSHLTLGNTAAVPAQLQRLALTNLDIAVTELDIRIPKPVDATKLAAQQAAYASVTRACLIIPKCVGITVWGVSDRYSWVDTTLPTFDSPLAWDDDYRKKAAYNGIEYALDNEL
ncbi:glycosyl hydrolase family 10 protein [Ephemerocybe angulata]|uniref:Beta-xylanase n=1 Tax=Ephemerocybe angulata TaxID=980116 RepID=A0A8H6I1C3_9AGAR|nr:glycosyl hydrolase family 10 protein [Tulosesus angulatus]